MTIVLFDTPQSLLQLYPISLIFPVAAVRHGLFTGVEWYKKASGKEVYSISASYKNSPLIPGHDDHYLCIDAAVIPTRNLFEECMALEKGQMLEDDGGMIAYVINKPPEYGNLPLFLQAKNVRAAVKRITHPMDWVKTNEEKIKQDIAWIASENEMLSEENGNRIFGNNPVYVSPGAKVQGCTFNTESGPVFIGRDAVLMEGGLFRGPVAIGAGAVIKMGAQIYAGSTIGYKAVAGGELKNSILGDFSNKAHHGYLGDSIIGQWCNLGAGTTNSNVKNNAGEVKMWSAFLKDYVQVGQKAGMVMGHFSKTAINSSINTGTTIGCCSSIHDGGGTNKNIASFVWGDHHKYDFNKLVKDINTWMSFKQEKATEGLFDTLLHLYQTVLWPYDENHG